MHDLDRTMNEFEMGMDALESGDYEFEMWNQETYGGDGETVFDEVEEMELAANLLEITDEQELDQFLGSLAKKAGAFMRSPAGKALGGILKNVAKKALPIAGAAIGNFIVPGAGGAIGGKLAGMAGKAFGLELEGMSPQDQEFEVARRFVRFAADAARNLNEVAAPGAPPVQAAQQAAVISAQQHAPGLVNAIARGGVAGGAGALGNGRPGMGGARPRRPGGGGQSGRWVRRGNQIILFGV